MAEGTREVLADELTALPKDGKPAAAPAPASETGLSQPQTQTPGGAQEAANTMGAVSYGTLMGDERSFQPQTPAADQAIEVAAGPKIESARGSSGVEAAADAQSATSGEAAVSGSLGSERAGEAGTQVANANFTVRGIEVAVPGAGANAPAGAPGAPTDAAGAPVAAATGEGGPAGSAEGVAVGAGPGAGPSGTANAAAASRGGEALTGTAAGSLEGTTTGTLGFGSGPSAGTPPPPLQAASLRSDPVAAPVAAAPVPTPSAPPAPPPVEFQPVAIDPGQIAAPPPVQAPIEIPDTLATDPLLSASNATGTEDTAVPLDISAALGDADGSETLSITISGVPAGAQLTAGIDNGDGTWTLAPADLPGLAFVPAANASGTVALQISATSTEIRSGETSTRTTDLQIDIAAVADAPTLSASNATGSEDTAVPLNISAALGDTDGSETLSITVSGVPADGHLTVGIDNGDGTWTLAPGDLAGLAYVPGANDSGTFNLGITATATEANGSTSVRNATLSVDIAAVADAPTLTATNATGTEDTSVPLNISAALGDTDGSEVLSITISGVPADGQLTAGIDNGDGTWTLAPGDLAGLAYVPGANDSGTFNLGIAATATEANGSTSVRNTTVSVDVAAVADAPTLSAANATGTEDTSVPLNISSALGDTDGSETLSITISGVPADGHLTAGIDNGDGTWTLAPGDLTGLAYVPGANESGTFNLGITATATEANGSTSVRNATVSVDVAAVADAPTLTASNATGTEDTTVPLNISAALGDTDGSETLSITISGVPSDGHLTAGIDNGDGTWTLAPGDLAGLAYVPGANDSGTFNLGITATATEANGSTSVRNATLSVDVAAVADAPTLTASNATGTEDTAVPLNISAALGDADGSETLSITISGVPSEGHLTAGIDNGDGTWTLAPGDLAGLAYVPGANNSGTFNLGISAIATEANGSTSVRNATMSVDVAAVADAPTLTASNATGTEDNSVPLNISAALGDVDGSETLSITISGVPSEGHLTAGIDNGDGTWTLAPGDLAGLAYVPGANDSGTFNLGITATATEVNGTTSVRNATLSVDVAAVADAPTLTAANATGTEDTSVPLSISAALGDVDGSETLSITISGVPADGHLTAGVDNGDGTWTLAPGDLAGLAYVPGANDSGTFSLGITATATEANGSTSVRNATLSVDIAAVADAPTLTATNATGTEDTIVPLNISAALGDTDGSESLSIMVSGVPLEGHLTAGIDNGDGTWTLAPGDLAGLAYVPGANDSGTFNLGITATAMEANGSTSVRNATLSVDVAAVADAPTLTTTNATGTEDTAVPLNISAALGDTDGSEVLSITISGVPADGHLTAGIDNGDGTWTLAPGDLAGLSYVPGSNDSGTFNLAITATATEANGSTSVRNATLSVDVAAVADAPTLSASNAVGSEDTAVPLNISAALGDTDGSETLSITISGVPADGHLTAGIDNGDGTWTLAPGDLAGLAYVPGANDSGTFNLGITATATEANGSTSVRNATLSVDVAAVADAPTLTAANAAGTEDTAVPLNISAALGDTDGSETLSITISGVPADGHLTAGIDNGDGTWTLAPGDLAGLAYVPGANDSGTFNLAITATATEANGSTSVRNATIAVDVAAVADAPTLTATNATGTEDTIVPLNISAALGDIDGSEALSITISGVPSDGHLTAGIDNGDGTWTLAPGDLAGLSYVPGSNDSGTFNLGITATATEANGSTSVRNATIAVDVAAVADAPTLTATNATGSEDTAVPLNINAALGDIDGSETLSITISGVPSDGHLTAGIDNGDGTWTLAPGDLAGLAYVPGANDSGTFNLGITATATEANGSTSVRNATMAVDVAAVADAPTLTASNATGTEDTAVPLNISAALGDVDGSETLSITISGVPSDGHLTAGIDNGDGTWTLAPGDLAGLTYVPGANDSGTFNLGITATATEANGSTSVRNATLSVDVAAVADAPTLTASNATGTEDTAVPLNISAALGDTDGSESLSIMVSGVPLEGHLTAGIDNGDGTWTLAPGDLAGLAYVPGADASGSFTLHVSAKAVEANGSASERTADISVDVAATTDAPTSLSIDVRSAVGNDSTFANGETGQVTVVAQFRDNDGSQAHAATLAVPEGLIVTDAAGGTWTPGNDGTGGTISFGGVIAGNGLLNVTIGVRATDEIDANASGQFQLTATSAETNSASVSATATAATNLTTAPLTVAGTSGNDGFAASGLRESFQGGAGSDTVSYAADTAGVNVNLGAGTASGGLATGDVLSGIETLVGGSGADTLTGDTNANRLDGGAGDDTLTGGGGADTLVGGTGTDTASYSASAAGVTVNLSTGVGSGGDAASDSLSGIENVVGSANADTITGDGNANRLEGLAGNDRLDGGAGDDTLVGGLGSDTLIGGTGIDTASYANAAAGVTASLATATGTAGEASGDTYTTIENLEGSAFADTLTGDGNANVLTGGAGDDTLLGGAGADTLAGGAGNDTASYSTSSASVTVNLATGAGTQGDASGDVLTGIETLIGGSGADTFTGDDGANRIDGGAGNDTIAGGAGADTLIGGANTDTLTYAADTAGVNVNLAAGTGSGGDAAGDVISGFENVIGGSGDDALTGDAAANSLTGGLGDDTILGGAGGDTMAGGTGIDTVSYAGSTAGVSVNLATAAASGGDAASDVISGFENLIGSSNADTLTGDANVNVIDGGAGADTLAGGAGADTLIGGTGNDTATYAASTAAVTVNLATGAGTQGDAAGDVLSGIETLIGGSGNDTLTGDAAANALDGGTGDDTLAGGAGADTLTGGSGIDTVNYADSSAGVTVNLTAGTGVGGDAQGDVLATIENVIGSDHADTLTGSTAANALAGGEGDDTLIGGAGADSLAGGAGTDTASYSTSTASVTASLATGTGTAGDAAGDVLTGIENLTGGTAADTLTGDANANVIDGGSGNDTLAGGAGDDTLIGGTGTDTASYATSAGAVNVDLSTGTLSGGDAEGDVLSGIESLVGSANADTLTGDGAANSLDGGAGDDTITGGAGADTITGGAGADTANYAASAAAVNVSLTSNTGTGGDAQGDVLSGIENLVGSANADTLTGSTAANLLTGGAGDDTLLGGAGADTLAGGEGADTASYSTSTAAVTVNLAAGTVGGDAAGDVLTSIENLIGGSGADTFTGDDGANRIDGGSGNDTIEGGAGADTLIGGTNTDTLSYSADTTGVTVNLTTSSASGGAAAGDTISGFENITGGSGADTLTGDANANVLIGGLGDDTLTGGAGADTLTGGAGIDTANYAASTAAVTVSLATGAGSGGDAASDVLSSIENIVGSGLADTLTGDANANVLDGGAGADTLQGGAGADTLIGGTGNDTATYAASTAAVTVNLTTGEGTQGDADGDVLSGIETLIGGSGNDTLTGDAAANRIDGGTGNDTIFGGAGADTLIGGTGTDTVNYADSGAGVAVNLSTGAGTGGDAQGDTYTTIENVVGSAYADTLTGSTAANRLEGGDGDDTLIGGSGADTLVGGAGIDTANYSSSTSVLSVNLLTAAVSGDAAGDVLSGIENVTGGTRNDTLTGDDGANVLSGMAGNDTLTGGLGDDTLIGGAGSDSLVGGTGSDTADYSTSTASVTVSLATNTGTVGDASGDVLSGIENLTGGSAADTLTGDGNANILTGGAGNDTLNGGAGNDTLIGGAGSDSLVGGTGTDTADYGTSSAGVSVNLATGAVSGGDAAGDTFSGIENLAGSANADTLTGDANANLLDGRFGDDTLSGGAGNDTLMGGSGNDLLVGGDGSDLAYFGAGWGNDVFQGGAAGGWTDTVFIDGVTGGPGAGGWTLTLADGTVITDASAHGSIDLAADSSGTVVMSDGSELTFEGVEKFQW